MILSRRLTFFLLLSPCPSTNSHNSGHLAALKHSLRRLVQSVLIKQAGSAAPGDLLDMQTLRPDPRLSESDDCGWNLTVCIFTSPPRNSHACWSLRTSVGKGSPQRMKCPMAESKRTCPLGSEDSCSL